MLDSIMKKLVFLHLTLIVLFTIIISVVCIHLSMYILAVTIVSNKYNIEIDIFMCSFAMSGIWHIYFIVSLFHSYGKKALFYFFTFIIILFIISIALLDLYIYYVIHNITTQAKYGFYAIYSMLHGMTDDKSNYVNIINYYNKAPFDTFISVHKSIVDGYLHEHYDIRFWSIRSPLDYFQALNISEIVAYKCHVTHDIAYSHFVNDALHDAEIYYKLIYNPIIFSSTMLLAAITIMFCYKLVTDAITNATIKINKYSKDSRDSKDSRYSKYKKYLKNMFLKLFVDITSYKNIETVASFIIYSSIKIIANVYILVIIFFIHKDYTLIYDFWLQLILVGLCRLFLNQTISLFRKIFVNCTIQFIILIPYIYFFLKYNVVEHLSTISSPDTVSNIFTITKNSLQYWNTEQFLNSTIRDNFYWLYNSILSFYYSYIADHLYKIIDLFNQGPMKYNSPSYSIMYNVFTMLYITYISYLQFDFSLKILLIFSSKLRTFFNNHKKGFRISYNTLISMIFIYRPCSVYNTWFINTELNDYFSASSIITILLTSYIIFYVIYYVWLVKKPLDIYVNFKD